MECLNPISIPDPETGHLRVVPCGRCNACLVRSRMEWAFRLREEWHRSPSSFFVTLTYEDERMPISTSVEYSTGALVYDGSVNKRDVQLFMKRLRKSIDPVKLRYYLISEYGPDTLRPHYHFIAFLDALVSPDYFDSHVRKCWPSPIVTVSSVTETRIKYVTEYALTRNSVPDRLAPNFRLVSRNPGIGASYVERMKDWHTGVDDMSKRYDLLDKDGFHCNMPRYYREKIYPADFLDERSAELEKEFLQKKLELVSRPDYDAAQAIRNRKAFIEDYNRKTQFLLDKKRKKL